MGEQLTSQHPLCYPPPLIKVSKPNQIDLPMQFRAVGISSPVRKLVRVGVRERVDY